VYNGKSLIHNFNKKMNKNYAGIIIFILIFIGVSYLLINNKNEEKIITTPTEKMESKEEKTVNEEPTADVPAASNEANQSIDNSVANNSTNQSVKNMQHIITIKTNKGEIKFSTYDADAPKTVENFITLAQKGFYDKTRFHRVIKNFMIQGGDPLSKDDSKRSEWGTGGPGYTIPAEIKRKNTRGTVATARQGDQVNPKRDSSGSQFYINTVDNISLDGGYTVFGEVIEGMDVVDKIGNTATASSDQPAEDIIVEKVTVAEAPQK
jgi:cyclophilin family peptidyl-prolyl cis-trans isomerase